ncbi:zinc-type alcohol dehydrogenase-like protein [Limtongia smithiae]|uniref:zinc-type alcohol dehydrogenase-like protein n=1 Tax=Limtongia smithiae TaxID=1125753 RepID=UPI0034CE3579
MTTSTMKTLFLTRNAPTTAPQLALTTLPVPALKPGCALVRVLYSVIHPSDRLNSQGNFPYTTFPRIPGRDYAGIVTDIMTNSEEDKAWIGKTVYGTSGPNLGFDLDGTHAQYCLLPITSLVEKPASLPTNLAATVGVPFSTAFMCLERAQTKPSDTVLVIGSHGAVGSAAAQMAKAMGCRRVLTVARRRHPAMPDILLTPDLDFGAAILSVTDGKGIDVVIDTVGDMALMSTAINNLGKRGRLAWIASPRGTANKDVTFDALMAYRKEITLVGVNSISPSLERMAEYFRSMSKWIDGNELLAQKVDEFSVIPLDDAVLDGYLKPGQKTIIDMS